MKSIALAGISFVVAAVCGNLRAQETPMFPTPEKEHAWLEQFAGDWELEIEAMMEPGKPPLKFKGTDKGRMIGGFWAIVEGKSEIMGMTFTSLLTLGYDAEKKKYVGTWVDSIQSTLWKYEGSVDKSGKILTLETEGPSPVAPGKTCKFKEVTEFKSKDHRVFTSTMLGDDGKWTTILTVNARRKK